jgi:flagellar biosynthesis/type III secretory pathway chaperone
MSRKTSRGQQILDGLKAEKQGYEALLALLDQEWECLKQRDITGLIPLTRAKEKRLLELHELAQKIRPGLPLEKTAGQRAEIGGTIGGSEARASDPWEAPLAKIQKSIRKLKMEIQARNERNRRYIEESLRVIEEFFALLAPPPGKPPAYGPFENQRAMNSGGFSSFISRRL